MKRQWCTACHTIAYVGVRTVECEWILCQLHPTWHHAPISFVNYLAELRRDFYATGEAKVKHAAMEAAWRLSERL